MTMTKEVQRIAIAEACGWTGIKPSGPFRNLCGYVPNADELDAQGALENVFEIPDYLSDLNAIHEAEKVLTSQQCWDYRDKLKEIIQMGGCCAANAYHFHATAAQRAEAFLRTLNLWKD